MELEERDKRNSWEERMGKHLLNKNAKIYSYTHLSPDWEVT